VPGTTRAQPFRLGCTSGQSSPEPLADAVDYQQVEGDIGRTAPAKEQIVELRAASVVEHHKLAVKHVALRQLIERRLEALHPVAVARDQTPRMVSAAARKPSKARATSLAVR
jgi:hypothetical protein